MKSQSNIAELDLVKALKKRELKAQELFYKQFGPAILGVCYRYLQPKENAEEVFHDVILKIYDKIGKYAGSGSLGAWSKRVAANTCLDYLRKHKNQLRINYIEEQTIEIEGDTEEELNELEEAQISDVLKAMEQIPEQQRVVLNLFVMEGFSHKEIAHKLEITEGASRSLMLRAKRNLKERIGEKKTELISHEGRR